MPPTGSGASPPCWHATVCNTAPACARPNYRSDSSNAWPSAARRSRRRRCCWPTSPPPTWTRSKRRKPCSCCARCISPAPPWCWPATTPASPRTRPASCNWPPGASWPTPNTPEETSMRAFLHSIQRRLARHGRAAGAWRDMLELLSATALCALLEGWWRLRYSEAMTISAARLTLALLPIAPLTLAAAAAGRQALSAALRLSIATSGGMGIALLLLPSFAAPNAPPPLALTALAACAAALAVAAHAAWRTWNVPAAYDLAVSASAEDVAGEPGDDTDKEHAGTAIEQRLRALYAASPLLARRKPHPVSRYRRALTPLLLAVYALLLDKHHQPQSHGDDELTRAGDDNHANTHHHTTGLADMAGDGAITWHHPRMNGPATPTLQLLAVAETLHASRPPPHLENGSVTSGMANAGHATPPLMSGANSPAAGAPPTAPAHADLSHAAMMGALAYADTATNIYGSGTEAALHNPPLIRSPLGSTTLVWSEIKAIAIPPLSNLQQESVTQIGAADLLAVSTLSSSAAESPHTPSNNTGATGLAISALSLISAQSIAALSQSSIGSQAGLVETILAATPPADASAAHAGATSESSPSSAIVIVGQPLDGHVSGLHLG